MGDCLLSVDFGVEPVETETLVGEVGQTGSKMRWNKNRSLLGVLSQKSNQIRVFLNNRQSHLVALGDHDQLTDFLWGGSDPLDDLMTSNFLVAWGEDFIKVWDIDLAELRTKH